jgi:hypothetical protein
LVFALLGGDTNGEIGDVADCEIDDIALVALVFAPLGIDTDGGIGDDSTTTEGGGGNVG